MPDIPTTIAAQIAAARRTTPFGHLSREDLTGLIRRTAQLCRVEVAEVEPHLPLAMKATT